MSPISAQGSQWDSMQALVGLRPTAALAQKWVLDCVFHVGIGCTKIIEQGELNARRCGYRC